MKVGVAGRETGVGIELTVAVVLTLLRPSVEVDNRDCGLLKPEGCTFRGSSSDPPKGDDEGESASEANAWKRAAEGGLEALLSLSLGLVGEGESSMMRTQPDEFPAGVRLISSLSVACRLRSDVRERSSGDLID
jgi:hypothetical protein